jgi:branched-chain amino acid transport system substrate-binding protein
MKGALSNFWLAALVLMFLSGMSTAAEKAPVLIGLDAEFGHLTSTSDEAIKRGILIAIDEINQAGGVLGGRPLKLIERDNRSVPARANANLRELAALPDMTAVFCGKFSPVVFEVLPTLHELKLIMLDPWAAADDIIDNGYQPNYVFRLSLRDSWALPVMMRHAVSKKAQRIGILLPNTSWGRSSLKAAESYVAAHRNLEIVAAKWYNWGDKSLLDKYQALLSAGAQAVILVANEGEGSILVKEIAALPGDERISHWGVSGGDFAKLTGDALKEVDFSVVQTYSFINARREKTKRVLDGAKRLFGIEDMRQLLSPVGVAHAYDLTHLLAKAIDKAGNTDRPAIRHALENLPAWSGLIKDYRKPFTPTRHEALGPEEVFMARYEDGVLTKIPGERKK